MEYNIIWKIRLPRILMAAILGGALSLSVTAYAQSISFAPCHLEFSPIKGPEGNIEYLLHLKKLPEGEHCEEVPFKIDEVVEAAHKELSSTTPHPAQKR